MNVNLMVIKKIKSSCFCQVVYFLNVFIYFTENLISKANNKVLKRYSIKAYI